MTQVVLILIKMNQAMLLKRHQIIWLASVPHSNVNSNDLYLNNAYHSIDYDDDLTIRVRKIKLTRMYV